MGPDDKRKHYDVAICGAGPCGVALANLLGIYGVTTLLFDMEDDILNLPRAVGVCEEGSRILDNAGILKDGTVDFKEIANIHFLNADSKSTLHFDVGNNVGGYPSQRTFHQPQLERAMRSALRRFDCVDFLSSTEMVSFNVTDTEVQLQLSLDGCRDDITCTYFVGCDGSKSHVRKTLGLGFAGKTYQQDWLIIDVANNPLDSTDVHFSIDPDRPGITLPLPNGRRRWEFVVKSDDDPEQICSNEFVADLLSPWGDTSKMAVERKAIYAFHARTAPRFSKGRVFLAGDAAHITPPFAGQGMMAGLRDAQNLSWKLAGVLNRNLPERILETYTTERLPHTKQVINFARFIGQIVLPQNKLSSSIRDTTIKLLTLFGWYDAQHGAKLDRIPNHINGSLLNNFVKTKVLGTGIWFPQHTVEANGNQQLFDSAIAPTFCIVAWHQSVSNHLSARTLARWQSLGGQECVLSGKAELNALEDTSGGYQSYFADKPVAVIRPDRMVVLRCHASEIDTKLNRYLNELQGKDGGMLLKEESSAA